MKSDEIRKKVGELKNKAEELKNKAIGFISRSVGLKNKSARFKDRVAELKRKSGDVRIKAMKWLQIHKKESAAGAVLLVFLAVFLYMGRYSVRKLELENSVATPFEAMGVTAASGPVLDEDQVVILEGVLEALQKGDFERGGALLLDNEQKLQYLFFQVLKGEQYLYRDGEMLQELEGDGLVLKKPTSAFYGTFKEGAPEGNGVALQGIRLDGLRYDYAEGYWRDGRLNGLCTVGYRYYERAQGGESQAVERRGVFQDDLMTGAFTYRTTSDDGEVNFWNIEADNGRTVLDDRWIYNEKKQYFYLPAIENSSHTYVLPDNTVEEQLWRNMLLWDE